MAGPAHDSFAVEVPAHGRTAVACCSRGLHVGWHRNMDIIGVPGVEAEAELLAAIVTLLERLELTAEDVVRTPL